MITIEEFKKKQSNKTRLVGLDLGSKRIGVSICDDKQSIATPFKTINKTNKTDLINDLNTIIEENNITAIIIGYPLNMDGTPGRSAQSVNDIAKNISKSINIPVCLWDERLSTVAAERVLLEADTTRKRRAEVIDHVAAGYILQGALDRANHIRAGK